ncbi:MAG: hypothetical protein M3Q69_14230 [Acidobacteriota bacterium]|nr:hypothetical protein [Acidobacteriota bacterium]
MNALVLFITLTSTIVLRSGDRLTVDGVPREEKGVITFRANGVLYSMPSTEVDRIEKNDDSSSNAAPVRKLRVSDEERKRLIDELQKNHNGTPAQPLRVADAVPPPPTKEEVAQEKRDELQWRRDARAYEENVTRAREELALLQTRLEELQSQINSFLSLGYRPGQFTYQTTQLERTRARIPYAELEVTRAERAYAQFREDARRQGVPPGWLR